MLDTVVYAYVMPVDCGENVEPRGYFVEGAVLAQVFSALSTPPEDRR
ncbi:MAG: hypothetical protein AAGH70_09995 [Pseudomonadota bacterium]